MIEELKHFPISDLSPEGEVLYEVPVEFISSSRYFYGGLCKNCFFFTKQNLCYGMGTGLNDDGSTRGPANTHCFKHDIVFISLTQLVTRQLKGEIS